MNHVDVYYTIIDRKRCGYVCKMFLYDLILHSTEKRNNCIVIVVSIKIKRFFYGLQLQKLSFGDSKSNQIK